MRRILIIITAVICLCGCEKESHHWLYGYWYGQYDEHLISKEFSADGSECAVTTAFTNGNLGMNEVNCFVYVNEQNQNFFMNEGPVWSSKLDYSGYLSDDKIECFGSPKKQVKRAVKCTWLPVAFRLLTKSFTNFDMGS